MVKPTRQSPLLHSVIIAISVWLVLTSLFLFGMFDGWQASLSDRLFITSRATSSPIAIVAIDNQSITSLGRWPWDRSVHGQLLQHLASYQPAAIGYDVTFSEASPQDSQLTSALATSSHTVLAAEASGITTTSTGDTISHLLTPLPQFQAVASTGVVNLIPSADKIVRFSPLRYSYQSQPLQSFDLAVIDQYFQSTGVGNLNSLLATAPTETGLLRINYQTGTSFPTYSAADIIQDQIDPQVLKGKIVLIGATAPDLHDDHLTPISSQLVPGVTIHANVINTLLSGNFLVPESSLTTLATMLILCFILGFIITKFGIRWLIIVFPLFLLGYLGFTVYSFDQGIIRNLIFPPLTIITLAVVAVAYRYLWERLQKQYVRGAMSLYLSPQIMEDVLSDPKKLKLGGLRKTMTVLFSDIASFTTISEKLAADDLSRELNNYLTRMTDIVFDHQGVVDKYIGDAVMAFWNAPISQPEHALLACQAALHMMQQVRDMGPQWQQFGIDHFTIRIGINTGDMVVGNMGSTRRFDYTVIGDNVNLGSRLEGINKQYGTSICISSSTYQLVRDQVVARKLDSVAVKGKSKGVAIYELRGLGHPDIPEQQFISAFESALALYQKGKFKSALIAFQTFHHQYPDDPPTPIFIDRCQELIKSPPDHWDGTFHATSK